MHRPLGDDSRHVPLIFAAFAVLLVIVCAGRLAVGSSGIGFPDVEAPAWSTIMEARCTRLVIGVVVGVALAVSGVALQALLRNPLAEPYILGLSTGAGAGVMAQSWLVFALGIAAGPTFLGAAVGAIASMAVVFVAGQRRGVIDPLGLLLTGVVLSAINGALIMLFNYAVGPGGIRDDLARWMMGSLSEASGPITSGIVITTAAAGLAVLLTQARAMDVATLSETEATSLGVNVPRMRAILFAVASLLAAGAVVLSGPVAFVGLICPHLARSLLGPRHGSLMLGSAILGAALVVVADTASSLIAYRFGTGLIPLGVFTAMLGGPAFLWMLRPQLGRGLE